MVTAGSGKHTNPTEYGGSCESVWKFQGDQSVGLEERGMPDATSEGKKV